MVRVLLLDFREAFDRVDHKILLSKLSNDGVYAGVPQGQLMRPQCLLVHIDDLKTIYDNEKYVNDTSVAEACDRCGENSNIQRAANKAVKWYTENNMQLNTDKQKKWEYILARNLCNYYQSAQIIMNEIDCVSVFKLLGLMFNNCLTWSDYIDYICGTVSQRIYFLCLLKRSGKPSSDRVEVSVPWSYQFWSMLLRFGIPV